MTLNRAAIGAWAAALAVLLFWTFGALGANRAVDEKYKDARAAAVPQANFYRVVAGEGEGGLGSMYKLARDLHAIGGAEQPLTGVALREELNSFKGSSNRYGGITEELGFDPFDGDNCSECGPLDRDVIDNVMTVKEGHLQQVISDLEPSKPKHEDGAPAVLWILWVLALPVGALVLYMRQHESQKKRYGSYEQEMHLVDRLGRTMAALPAGGRDYEELSDLRARLKDSIETRVGYRERARSRAEIESVAEEARATLDAIVAGNKELE